METKSNLAIIHYNQANLDLFFSKLKFFPNVSELYSKFQKNFIKFPSFGSDKSYT